MLKAKIFEIVCSIPRGKVMTYGTIAVMLGNHRLARVVGNALHTNKDKYSVPCYRVVNSRGMLSESYSFGGIKEQQRLLEADGIEVANGRVALDVYGYYPQVNTREPDADKK